jgi:Fe2+ transport system protein FeoA
MSPTTKVHGALAATSVGSRVCIVGVEGGMRVQSRLLGMGLNAGTCIDVRRNDGKGPVIVAVGHARIALGRAMAEKVRVGAVVGRGSEGEKERQSA